LNADSFVEELLNELGLAMKSLHSIHDTVEECEALLRVEELGVLPYNIDVHLFHTEDLLQS
jgi:hypothetical protein